MPPCGQASGLRHQIFGANNARRENLEGFWKGLFGFSHDIMVVNAFHENVKRHRAEGRELAEDEAEEESVFEFRPRPTQDMLVACLWSRWTANDEPVLLACAAITDEPPAEVAAAGHDRCIIPIRPEYIDVWPNQNPNSLGVLYTILDDRETPYIEHRLAAQGRPSRRPCNLDDSPRQHYEHLLAA